MYQLYHIRNSQSSLTHHQRHISNSVRHTDFLHLDQVSNRRPTGSASSPGCGRSGRPCRSRHYRPHLHPCRQKYHCCPGWQSGIYSNSFCQQDKSGCRFPSTAAMRCILRQWTAWACIIAPGWTGSPWTKTGNRISRLTRCGMGLRAVFLTRPAIPFGP